MLNGGPVPTSTLVVRDLAKGVRFFVEVLGTKLVAHSPTAATLDFGADCTVLLQEGTPVKQSLVFYTRGNFDEAVAVYGNRGVAMTREPLAAHFDGPEGHRFTLVPSPSV